MGEQRDEYGFCPKCGAVMLNGVCQSCGYGKRLGMPGDSGELHQPGKKKKMSAGGRVVIVLIIVLVILLAVFITLTIRAVVKQKEESSTLHIGEDFFDGFDNFYDDDDTYDEHDDWYDDYDDSSDLYVPSPDDEYYETIVDATVSGLSYGIEWYSFSVYPDGEGSQYYSATYPVLSGDNMELLEPVNETIRNTVCKYQSSYLDYEYGAYGTGYVTYMGEDRLSVVVRNELYGSDSQDSIYELDAVTFDMSTGQVIPYSELVQVDEETAKRFRSQDSLQNGTVEFVESLTDEELLEYLQDDGKRVVFCTPVGTELGFNYENGWVTVTLKDKAL